MKFEDWALQLLDPAHQVSVVLVVLFLEAVENHLVLRMQEVSFLLLDGLMKSEDWALQLLNAAHQVFVVLVVLSLDLVDL
jgi:hypothetical protein